jgi:acyl-coenzyme A synthetase/AMP-(fatty) acid ligase
MSDDLHINATTAGYIAYHAAERPHAVALINRGRAITYAQFDGDLRRFIRAVGELGLPRGSSVAVGHDDYYTQWLLLLSLERLGVATGSVANRDQLASTAMRAAVDCVFASPEFSVKGARSQIVLTDEWSQRIFASEDAAAGIPALLAAEDPVRVLQSSGTTGRPKRIILLRRMFEARVRQVIAQFELTARSRYLLTAGFNVGHVYGVATACLRAGATVVADFAPDRLHVARAMRDHGVTHVSMLPIHLKQVLDDLPPDFIKPPNLTIHPFGAAMSETLRDRALERLAVEVFRHYGCNEASTVVASRAPRKDGFASIWPDTAVEIVDEQDRPVPLGAVGYIRLRTACMVEGYPDDPEATRRHFRDGWFYPQDMGVMNEDRQLKVIGRRDEMLNIGGQKGAPTDLEEQVLKYASVEDVGVCSFPNASGVEEVYFAIVFTHGDAAEILRRITSATREFSLGNSYVVRLPRIPRNANGKIQRDELKQAVAMAAGRAP